MVAGLQAHASGIVTLEVLSNLDRQAHVLDLVREAASKETTWESGFVFNTLCCRPHPLALNAFGEFADRNLLKEQSVVGRGMEQDVVREYSRWFGAIDQNGRNGYVCSGGTEGNFVALWAAKARLPKRNKIVVSRYAHYSYDRFASPLHLQLSSIPLDVDLEVQRTAFLDAIDDETLAVIVTAGDPVLGRIDPLSDVLSKARACGCAVHIDAAYGGYFLPFLSEYRASYTDVLAPNRGPITLTLDPHKYGLCPLGTGLILFSDQEDLDRISLSVPFPPIESRTFQGSRSGGPTASVWAMMHFLGRGGYAQLADSLTEKRILLENRLRRIPELEFLVKPRLTSIGFRIQGDEAGTRHLYDDLSRIGYKITPQLRPSMFIRVIVHHHTEAWHIEKLAQSIEGILRS